MSPQFPLTRRVFLGGVSALAATAVARPAAARATDPEVRLHWLDGRGGLHLRNLGVDLPAVMRDVARGEGIPLLDLTARSQALVEGLGEAASWPLYLTLAHDGVDDATHLSRYGAERYAALVADAVAEARSPLARFLRPGRLRR
ncbi:hypothetical protein MUY14_00840 [Amycolatopsis sp. FBCC-B4732]|uniref:hypothetical protein n=1 Tax=Amycolatopsis sp. FBCC-B4732 TaxID=3079339 RepID=UPI001FF6050A|nr:hypothetical protein [Amycolatopsis sp. FBCC-B4732]UOX89225.1 hypothetical protein MUY14_00840 [Amycolatopsis sp. FBCC-B4732]